MRCTFLRCSIILVSLALCTCSIGGSGGGAGERKSGQPATISGKLGTGYTAARSLPRGGTAPAAVTAVICIPVRNGMPDFSSLIKTPVAADGSFQLDVTPGSADEMDVFLLVNENATTLEEKCAGPVVIKSASGSELVGIPLDFLTRGLDFGTVTTSGSDAVSSNSLESEQGAFSLTFDQLLETAYVGSLYKMARNDYVNRDPLTHQWFRYSYGQTFGGALSDAVNAPTTAASILAHQSYSFGVMALDPAGHTPDEVVSGTVNVEIVPPEPICIPASSDSFGPTSPLSSTHPLSSFVVSKTDPSALPTGYTSGYGIGGSILHPLNAGFWTVNVDRVEKALFDMDAAVSFTPQGQFMFYVPSFRIETDGSGRVTAVDLTWLAWDPPRSAYRTVTNLSTFARLGAGWALGLNSQSPETHEYIDRGTHVTSFAHNWYVSNPPPDGVLLDMVTTAYAIAGFSFGFSLNQPQ
jgi:hypothetical protein